MEYFFPKTENTVRQTDSLLKVTLPLPKGALPLQNKLSYRSEKNSNTTLL